MILKTEALKESRRQVNVLLLSDGRQMPNLVVQIGKACLQTRFNHRCCGLNELLVLMMRLFSRLIGGVSFVGLPSLNILREFGVYFKFYEAKIDSKIAQC